jgi:ZIP family zinc transporter
MEQSTILQLIGLGGLAGVLPVYLGIGVALLIQQTLHPKRQGFLIGLSAGILLYLFFDLMHEATELTNPRDLASSATFLGGLCVSFLGLVAIEHRARGSAIHPAFLAYMIALGIGLHNLGEGLALGASYTSGRWVLSALLLGGFALHNGTEGFGILGAAGKAPLSLNDIGLLGLIAGLPTCLGAVISGYTASPFLSLSSYTLAAGSLLYVIVSLVAYSYTGDRRMQTATGLFSGMSFMYITALILTFLLGVSS